MTKIRGNKGGRGFQFVLGAMVVAGAILLSGQSRAQDKTASIHGHVNNEIGSVIPNATVRFTKDTTTDFKKAKTLYTFPVDASGNYKGTGIAPDSYLVVVVVGDSSLDYFQDQVFKAGEDKLLDFDMSRKAYLDKLTPERKKEIEDFKTKQASQLAANKTVGNLNTLLKQARDANAAGKYDDALAAIKQATDQKPDEPLLWITEGESQVGIADAAFKAAKAAKQPADTPEIKQKYTDAAASFKKAVDLNAASKKPSSDIEATASDQMGTALGKGGDIAGANTAFEAAAKADPAGAGKHYLNEAVINYNGNKPDDAAAAAEKAAEAYKTAAADSKLPAAQKDADVQKEADAYYVKGQALIQKVSTDAAGKIVAPPGCMDAYQSYLELAPEGAHAAEVKDILTGFGQTVKSSYKADKKKKS